MELMTNPIHRNIYNQTNTIIQVLSKYGLVDMSKMTIENADKIHDEIIELLEKRGYGR